MTTDGGRDYWDSVAVQPDALPAGWRRRARAEHLAWVAAETAAETADTGALAGRWLKTDLFEERSPHRAVVPHLPGPTWVACDISPRLAADVAERVPRGVAADVRGLPFATAAFDGVLSTSTLDHFDHEREIHRSLAELHRVLRPGGRLLLTLDNRRQPLVRARNALPRRVQLRTGLVPFAVGVTLDARDGAAALAAAGFTVDSVRHLLHAPHVVGTRPARWGWYEHRVLPRFAGLADTAVAPWTGHFVAFSARA